MKFDNKLEYQLGFMFAPTTAELSMSELVASLPEMFAAAVPGSSLKVRFREPSFQEAYVQSGGGIARLQVLQWSNGVWRLSVSADRLDIFLSPLELESLTEAFTTFDEFVARVVPGLVQAAGQLTRLGFEPNRLVAIEVGEASLPLGAQDILVRLAELYGGGPLAARVRAQELIDLALRQDFGGELDLGGESVPVHRIENVGTVLSYVEGQRRSVLRAQWDYNTAPIRGERGFSGEAVAAFYDEARAWIVARHLALIG